jgi:hypothetical protein
MTASLGVEKVVQTLTAAGYRALERRLEVASIPFSFAAVLLGSETSLDLIVVADTLDEQPRDIARQVTALAQALDVAGSLRTLSTVLVGPRPNTDILNALAACCRVLPVGTVTREQGRELRNWLSVFSPLDIPKPSSAADDPLEELRSEAHEINGDTFERFVAAARRSKATVAELLVATLVQPLANLPKEAAK